MAGDPDAAGVDATAPAVVGDRFRHEVDVLGPLVDAVVAEDELRVAGSAKFDAGSGNWTPGPQGFPANSAGGFVPPGEWATAGEKGTELLFGGKKGVTVFSNGDSQDMVAGGGGATNIFQNFNIRANDASSFMRTQRQIARQAKRELQGA